MTVRITLWAATLILGATAVQAEIHQDRPSISVVTPRAEILRETARVSGSVVAITPVIVRAPQDGLTVRSLFVEDGDWVEAGDLLARLDARDLELSRSAVEADVARAAAVVRSAEAVAEAERAAHRLAEQQWERVSVLMDREAVSREVVEQRQAALQQAEAAVAQSAGELDGARAALQAADAHLATVMQHLAQTEIRAPVSGLVLSRPGQLGEIAGALFEIAADGALALDGRVLETDFLALSHSMTVELVLPGDRLETGTVMRLSGRIQPETRQGAALIALPANTPAFVGNFAHGEIILREVEGLTLPESTVRDGEAWLVEDGMVRRIRLVTGLQVDGRVMVDNLPATATIVRQIDAFVEEGMQVVPVEVTVSESFAAQAELQAPPDR